MPGLTIRKLADRTAFRVTRFDPETGEKYLVDGDGNRSPRPLAGVRLEEPVPDQVRISTTVVNNGVAEGWITLEGAKTISRPGGPAHDPDRPELLHNFRHAKTAVFHTVDGDVRFKVTHQPDKYVAGDDDTEKVTKEHYDSGNTRVDWFYDLVKES